MECRQNDKPPRSRVILLLTEVILPPTKAADAPTADGSAPCACTMMQTPARASSARHPEPSSGRVTELSRDTGAPRGVQENAEGCTRVFAGTERSVNSFSAPSATEMCESKIMLLDTKPRGSYADELTLLGFVHGEFANPLQTLMLNKLHQKMKS